MLPESGYYLEIQIAHLDENWADMLWYIGAYTFMPHIHILVEPAPGNILYKVIVQGAVLVHFFSTKSKLKYR